MTVARSRVSVSDRVMQAPFVLLCAIDRVGAATIPIIDPGERTVVARVDRVLRAPDVLGELSGSELTVEPADAASEVQRFVVFADGAMYGETIAVREIGRVDPEMSDDLAEP